MSKPRDIWWSYAKQMVKQYPDLKAEYAYIKECSTTSSITGMPRGGAVSDPTARAVLRELKPDKMAEMLAVEKAIHETEKMPNGKDRLKIVELVLWKKSHTIAGAAMQIPCHEQTAKEWHRSFIRLVAIKRGLLPEKNIPQSQKTVIQ